MICAIQTKGYGKLFLVVTIEDPVTNGFLIIPVTYL